MPDYVVYAIVVFSRSDEVILLKNSLWEAYTGIELVSHGQTLSATNTNTDVCTLNKTHFTDS